MRAMLRRFGLGPLAYRLYHAPFGAVRRSIAAGGPVEQWRDARGRRAMERAAAQLPPLPAAAGTAPVRLHLLTGEQFWYQSVFCLWTFARSADRPVAPVVVDDGSLRREHAAVLSRIFPQARIVVEAETVERLDRVLPASRFPTLRRRRAGFPLLRKLTDVHAGLTGWGLFLDSDLLFFRRPEMLLQWLDAPQCPVRATDVANCYGYPLELLAELAGRPVPEKVNTGILGLRSEELDWDRLEYWCRRLMERAGTHYYQEQALVALLLAERDHVVAPPEDYVTLPQPPEADECRAVMHHYVAGSKRWYFRHNWRRVLD